MANLWLAFHKPDFSMETIEVQLCMSVSVGSLRYRALEDAKSTPVPIHDNRTWRNLTQRSISCPSARPNRRRIQPTLT